MSAYKKPLPTITDDGRPFWEALRQQRFMLQRCNSCSKHQFPPRILCCHCGKRNVEWREVSGAGQVYSFTVVHRPPDTAFQKDVPYLLAIVQLDEGPRMMTNLVDCPLESARIGMRVAPVYEDVTDEVTLVKFRPAG
jgi:uncharacterized OB-fold protein